MTGAEPVLLTARADDVLTLTLNRPESLNAVTLELADVLRNALLEARKTGVRAIVLTGAGRGFCAGADLTETDLQSSGVSPRDILRDHYRPLIMTLHQMEIPTVAAVNGVAAGAGCSLALACDLRVAAASATFIQAFVRIGLVPDAGATWFLPRLVGPARAMELALLGDRVDAMTALQYGMVNRVVPDETLHHEAGTLATRLANGPHALGLIKRLLRMSLMSDLDSQLGHEEEAQGMAARTGDAREGVLAFLEKREARFTGH